MKNENISKIIDLSLEMSDLKTAEIADIIGVNPRQINRWRKGTSLLDVQTFLRICNLLKVEINTIIEILNK